jgi:hypothetical protein
MSIVNARLPHFRKQRRIINLYAISQYSKTTYKREQETKSTNIPSVLGL